MNDISYVSSKVLAKRGVAAVGGIAGGVALMIMGALPSVVGIAVGAAAGLLGLGALLSKDPDDKKPGGVLFAGGILALAAKLKLPFLGSAAGGLLGLGALGLFAMGVWNGIRFLKGLKSRR